MKRARERYVTTSLVPIRAVTCGGCGWNLAARSVAEIHSVGWRAYARLRSAGEPPGDFLCKTCREDVSPNEETQLSPEAEQGLFQSLQRAPRDAYPRVGAPGPKHQHTSRVK
jgi:hypothetical protein